MEKIRRSADSREH